jgi:hypothetical protein
MHDRKFLLIDRPEGPTWSLSAVTKSNIGSDKYRASHRLRSGRLLRIATNCEYVLHQLRYTNGSLREKIESGIAKNGFATNQYDSTNAHLGYVSSVAHDEPTASLASLNAVHKQFWDDATGRPLPPALVKKARSEEMEEVYRTNLYTKVPEQECYDVTGKPPISTRWVDINKGDDVAPECRSRIVAQEIKANDIYRDDLFAATPPLEAKKMLFSLATTEGIGYFGSDTASGMKIEFIDIRRAYYQAHVRRQLYVKLPTEDHTPGMCGRLNKAL